MSVRLYMDVNVRDEITQGPRRRGIDVLTAQEDGSRRLPDSQLLDRATAFKRVLVTHDTDHLADAASRQRSGYQFGGIVYAHPLTITIARFIDDLELIANACAEEEVANQVLYLPLK